MITDVLSSAMLIGLQGSDNKGALLFGRLLPPSLLKLVFADVSFAAIYIIGTFGSSLSTVYAYNASNTSGHTKKSTVNAMTLVSFSLGNIIGTEIFQPKDAPAYIPGKIAILVLLTAQIGVSLLLRWINVRLNKKKQLSLAEEKARHGWTDAEVQRERERHAFADLTDKQ